MFTNLTGFHFLLNNRTIGNSGVYHEYQLSECVHAISLFTSSFINNRISLKHQPYSCGTNHQLHSTEIFKWQYYTCDSGRMRERRRVYWRGEGNISESHSLLSNREETILSRLVGEGVGSAVAMNWLRRRTYA